MSLDVHLWIPGEPEKLTQSTIFLREDGQTRELSREEWDARFPDREPVVIEMPTTNEVYWRNITHNLTKMADAAGIYDAMWRPDEHGMTHARMLIEPLRDGLRKLRAEPERFKAFNPSNGWGNYDGLVSFVAEYLQACIDHPDAEVSVSR